MRSVAIALCAGLALLTVCACFAVAKEGAPLKRPFEVQDLFELESLGIYYSGPVAFSGDGRELAMTRLRAKKTLKHFKWEYLMNESGDVWVQLESGQPLVNITNGVSDGSGWWAPQWSPDGARLAMLSTRGDNIYLWIWDVKTRTLSQLSQKPVDLFLGRPYLWVDNAHVLFPALPVGAPMFANNIETQTPAIAAAEWPKADEGKVSTASEVRSGLGQRSDHVSDQELLIVDASTGAKRQIATGSTGSWLLSPNGRAIAFIRITAPYSPKAKIPLRSNRADVASLVIVSADGTPIMVPAGIESDVLPRSLSWSPDGKELAYLRYGAANDTPLVLNRLEIGTARFSTLPLNSLDSNALLQEGVSLHWTRARDLVLRAPRAQTDSTLHSHGRSDWWRAGTDGDLRCLTESQEAPSDGFFLEYHDSTFLTSSGGRLLLIDARSGNARDFIPGAKMKLQEVIWPQRPAWGMDINSTSRIIFADYIRNRADTYTLNVNSREIRRLKSPDAKASLIAFSEEASAAVWLADDRDGLRIWRTNVFTGSSQQILGANGFLRGIAEGATQSFDYTSLTGKRLKAWLLLPASYVPGKRYPLVTWVYAGYEAGPTPPGEFAMVGANSEAFNLQLLSSHGYAVLVPSMPLSPEGELDNPLSKLTDGVLPAVDKSIEIGIADPAKIFLLGHSFGGFSALGLVTQTNRFKAAVAIAGISNFTSYYGLFDARRRYTDHPLEQFFSPWLMENGQAGMGAPPWEDPDRYRRNSPLTYVNQVETPLMIIQGDFDYVPVEQGEEFFSALYRQAKPAAFVRYWGEGHVLESPANVKDMWARIFGWFDDWGRSATKDTGRQ